MTAERITRKEVEDALRDICDDRTGSGRDSERRAYLLGVLGWMTRTGRANFTEADAAANRKAAGLQGDEP